MFSALTVTLPAPLAPRNTSVVPSYSDHLVFQKASQGSNGQLCTEVHQNQHTHQHTHQSTLASLFHSPSVILPAPPSMPGTMARNVFQPYGEVMPRLTPPCAPHTGPFSSLEGAFQPMPLSSNLPRSQWKKPGRWCAMHAHIAWKVHHHKQSIKKMQVESKTLAPNENPSQELSGKLNNLVQPFISTSAQTDRGRSNGQPLAIAVPLPCLTHSDPSKDFNTMDKSWVLECGRVWDSSTRKRELECENQIKVKKVKRVDRDRDNVQEDSNEGARLQRPRDMLFGSPVRQTPSFHAPSVHQIAMRSIRPGSHTVSGGYNLSRTHYTSSGKLTIYEGAERPYRAALRAPQRLPGWYRGMNLPQHPQSGMRTQPLAAGWSQRNEPYQAFTQTSIQSSLAMMQQERNFLKEQDNLHMLRDDDHHQYEALQHLHNAAVSSRLPSPSHLPSPYSASQMCQMGVPQTYQGSHIHSLHSHVPSGTHYPLVSISGAPHRNTSVGRSHSIRLIDPSKQWTP